MSEIRKLKVMITQYTEPEYLHFVLPHIPQFVFEKSNGRKRKCKRLRHHYDYKRLTKKIIVDIREELKGFIGQRI